MVTLSFRYDVNGLRAIAVIAVVIFHFMPDTLPGGFAGVDVFFVISGYLMTKIIFVGIERREFKLSKFYLARVNRILPSLYFLTFILLFLYFIINPNDYTNLLKHIVSSLLFVSNFVYWRESGYFDSTAIEKWLLHTWSLSVEWQFYLIFPIAILFLAKVFSLNKIKITFLISTLFIFLLNILVSYNWSSASYFLLPTRAWEMMFGGLVFLYPLSLKPITSKIIEVIGISLIIYSYFFVSSENQWPGYLALLPVFGSYCVLLANNQRSIFTNNRAFQYIGKISYSLYLWHWPSLVAANFLGIENKLLFASLATLIFSLSNYYLIEKHNNIKNAIIYIVKDKHHLLCYCLLLSCVSYMYFYLVNYIKSNPENFSQYLIGYDYVSKGDLLDSKPGINNYINGADNNNLDLIVIGDSNSAHLSYGISTTSNLKVINKWERSCLSLIDYTTKPYAKWMNAEWLEKCTKLYTFSDISKSTPIVIAQQWEQKGLICTDKSCDESEASYDDILSFQLEKLFKYLGDRPVFIIGQVPAPLNSVASCMKKYNNNSCDNITNKFTYERVKTNENLKNIADKYNNVHFINPFEAFCDDELNCKIVINNKSIFYDTVHFTAYGSSIAWPYIESKITKFL